MEQTQSILVTLRNMLGIEQNSDAFDSEIIPLINSYIMVLNQVGVGKEGFSITGEREQWGDFIDDLSIFEGAKTYLFIRTKLAWDPPANAALIASYEKIQNELEWRLNVRAENA